MESFRIIIASSREEIRVKMRNSLSSRHGFTVLQDSPLSEDLLEIVPNAPADLILIDPLGAEGDPGELLLRLQEKAPGTVFILLSDDVQPRACRSYFSAGVMGILSPDSSPQVLYKAIGTVLRGEHWISRKMAGKVFSEIFGREKPRETPALQDDLLTNRELEILTLVSRGCRNKEIGESLSISEKTVKTHLTNIFGKLKIQNRLQAALYANRHFPDKDPAPLQPVA